MVRHLLHTQIALLLLVVAEPGARADEAATAERLRAAQQAFDAGRYLQVVDQLKGLDQEDPLAPKAQFLLAYAYYKLGRLVQAEQLLDRLLAERFSAQVALLRGMVAYGQGQWTMARTHLSAVVATEEDPWATSARGVLDRVRAEEKVAKDGLFNREIDLAKRRLKAKDFRAAERALKQAEQARPDHFLTSYYRGYLAYELGRYRLANAKFRQALKREPSDSWSRYMLALSLSESGKVSEARDLLQQLASKGKEDEVRGLSRRALTLLDNPRTRLRGGPFANVEVGTGIDSNPAYIEERADLAETGLELHVAAKGGYQLWITQSLQTTLGLRAFERFYAIAGERYEQTEISGWGSLSMVHKSFRFDTTYTYTLFMYGHEPLFSTHVVDAEGSLAVLPGLRLVAAGWVGWRPVHDDTYQYLGGLQLGGGLKARWRWRRLFVETGYGFYRDWRNAMELLLPNTVIRFDYTKVGHGPLLWLELDLPWGLALSGGVGVQWKAFDYGDTESSTATYNTIRYEPRRDVRLAAEAELTWDLPAGLALGLRYESLDNFSSFTEEGRELDLNYSRRLVGVVLRWSFPMD